MDLQKQHTQSSSLTKPNSRSLWVYNFSVLFDITKITEFIPLPSMNLEEQLNAVTRFILYLSVLLFLYKQNVRIFFLPIIVMILIYVVVTYTNILERYENLTDKDTFQMYPRHVCYERPTTNNPFMNVLLTDYRTKPNRGSAMPSWNRRGVQQSINQEFEKRLFKNVGDIYNTNNSQRQFYTMPNTQLANNQGDFANWLYNSETSKNPDIMKKY
tara:strand:+ start:235 stop:876 length:642 start_codon:yes stop_codon:yes gene_type:complete